jgi:hypothetical protein
VLLLVELKPIPKSVAVWLQRVRMEKPQHQLDREKSHMFALEVFISESVPIFHHFSGTDS